MQFTSCQFLQLKEEFFICRVIFPHIFYVFKFSHHSTAFLVGTNSQCSSYIRHFFVYKAVVCQVVSPHKLKQKAFPAFDGAFFFLPLPFFFLCDAMWWRFLFLIRAPLLIKLYFFSVLSMVLIFNHHQNISLSYFLRRSHDLAFCCLVLISTFLFHRFLLLSKVKVM